LGTFWKRLGAEWPDPVDVPPLSPQFERFGEADAWRAIGFQLRVTQDISSRLQIRNATGDRMLQVQNGRLHYNWLGQAGGAYPRYEKVRPEFDRLLAEFLRFLADESLGEMQPNQWEVTYVNHIPKGTVWNAPDDWAELFHCLGKFPAHGAPVEMESFGGEWHYLIPPRQGRLHVKFEHGRQAEQKGAEILVLTLTARGPVQDQGGQKLSLDQGLDLGHETIVTTFRELTSEPAHRYWGLTP
jgi:uncharacterized protein (TIGR04255 family)